MAQGVKTKVKDVIEAINQSNGMLSVAARRLGLDRRTMYKIIDRYPVVKKAVKEAREYNLDLTELKLQQAVREGEAWAVIWTLKTQGRERGYIERVEHSGDKDNPIVLQISNAAEKCRESLLRINERKRVVHEINPTGGGDDGQRAIQSQDGTTSTDA